MRLAVSGPVAWLASLALVVVYIGVAYVGPAKLQRAPNHSPGQILFRAACRAALCLVAPLVVFAFTTEEEGGPTPGEILGLRFDNLFASATIPLFLTAIFFTGPLFRTLLTSWLLAKAELRHAAAEAAALRARGRPPTSAAQSTSTPTSASDVRRRPGGEPFPPSTGGTVAPEDPILAAVGEDACEWAPPSSVTAPSSAAATAAVAAAATTTASVGGVAFADPATMEAFGRQLVSQLFVPGGAYVPLDALPFVQARNFVLAPLMEEWIFRACMLSILAAADWSAWALTTVAPLLFGLAHIPHALEVRRTHPHLPWSAAVLSSLFQAAYTTLFGAYAAFLFLRTGNFVAPFLVHAFCNVMGLPDLAWWTDPADPAARYRPVILAGFVLGVFLFAVLVSPASDPSLFAGGWVLRP